eukprot:10352413-Ditylum_brightwellii.AAC.1
MGCKWKSITWGEMVCFFGILLRISMDPRRIDGYVSYFQDDPILNLGHGHHVGLCGYGSWAKEVMLLDHFHQICSSFHPELSDSRETGDKYHQLRYFI